MGELVLIGVLCLCVLGYVSVWLWRRSADRRQEVQRARQTIEQWENEQRQIEHRKFNREFLDSLTDDDRERFLKMWRGEERG
jgi:uncharacterized membrane-anchored protein YhcB (DUF1043 family)